MNYQESLDFLYQRLPMFQRIGKAALKPDLRNTMELMRLLDHPEKSFKSVHIAGTNGKGSSAHALASILQSAGYRTGLYTSPHLKSFTERIRVNGESIKEEKVASFVSQWKPEIEEIQPSFFELTVAMAFDYFRSETVDIAIIEVGLGGRLDSTNVITPEVCLITNIGFDHTELLGDTLEKIASEKAGIIKPNIPVVIGTYQSETYPVFQEIAKANDSMLILADSAVEEISTEWLTSNISYQNESYALDITADYFIKNIPGILETIKVLINEGYVIDKQSIKDGLSSVKKQTGMLGRYQLIGQKPYIIADVSHNEPGIKALLEQIHRSATRKLHLIYGTVRDKSITRILSLFPKDASYYFTQSQTPRSFPVDELSNLAKTIGITGEKFDDVNLALTEAKKEAEIDDLILVTGSTFVVAEINDL